MRLSARVFIVAALLMEGVSAQAQAQRVSSLASAQVPPPDLPTGPGPRGTSGEGGTARYDEVGYTESTGSEHAPLVISGALPAGSYVEVTALDSGKTILARVAAGPVTQGRLAGISPGAASALGLANGGAIRLRRVTPVPTDEVALRNGNAAANRPDAPPVLLVALRHKLGTPASAPVVPERPRPAPGIVAAKAVTVARRGERLPKPPATVVGHYYIQIAALSNRQHAEALARSAGGHIVAGGALFRVRLGPYLSAAAAQHARDGIAQHGYGDARVTHDD